MPSEPNPNAPRCAVRALVALILGLGACGGEAGAPRSGEGARPDVLLIVVDTLRRDSLGCYGAPEGATPHLDRLAADAVRYDRAYSQAPWTTPSLGSLLTSQYPAVLGIRGDRSVLPAGFELLPEVLRDHGWTTGAVVSHKFCSSEWGFDRGFDVFDEHNILGHQGIVAPGVTRRGLGFLRKHADEPVFLWLHYFDPHNEYHRHEGHGAPAPTGYDGPVTSGGSFRRLREAVDTLTADDWAEMRRLYASEVSFTDQHVGRVLDRLRAQGRYDDALIVFTSDHGEEFGEHGYLGHAHSLYDELVRVPLLIKYPRGEAGVVDDPVALLDVFPTVLDVLGLPRRPDLVGRSLRGGTDPDRIVYSETSRKRLLRAAIGQGRKLIHDLETDELELYDLRTDAGEQDDRFAPDTPDPLRGALDDFVATLRAQAGAGEERELSDAEQADLRALGYGGEE